LVSVEAVGPPPTDIVELRVGLGTELQIQRRIDIAETPFSDQFVFELPADLDPREAPLIRVEIAGEDELAADNTAWALLEPPPLEVGYGGDAPRFVREALSIELSPGLAGAAVRLAFGGAQAGRVTELPTIWAGSPPIGLPVDFAEQRARGTISNQDSSHPVTRGLELRGIVLEAYRPMVLPDQAEVLARVGDAPVIAALEFQGRRHIVLSFPIDASDFPLRTAFPVFWAQATSWVVDQTSLARPARYSRAYDRISIPTDTVEILGPRGDSITSFESDSFILPPITGVYTVRANSAEPTAIVNLLDSGESDIRRRIGRTNADAGAEGQTSYGDSVASVPSSTEILLILIMLAFAALAWDWSIGVRRT
jgi:hypothetical protein